MIFVLSRQLEDFDSVQPSKHFLLLLFSYEKHCVLYQKSLMLEFTLGERVFCFNTWMNIVLLIFQIKVTVLPLMSLMLNSESWELKNI